MRLVVPCHDEAARLDVEAFARALDAQRDLALLFVDDGSRDGTPFVLRALAARLNGRHPGRCAVLTLAANVGKAEAVRAGLRAVLALPAAQRGAYVGYWDADLATPLDAVPDLAAVLDAHADCAAALGARVRLLGRDIERRATRHLAGRVFATAASLALRIPVYDTQCGAKLFRADVRLAAHLDAPFASRWAFDVELLARLCTEGARPGLLREVPLRAWRDVAGSKVRLHAALRATLDLLRVAREARRRPAVRGAARVATPGTVPRRA